MSSFVQVDQEFIHHSRDAVRNNEIARLVVQTDMHGLSIELPDGHVVVIDQCAGSISISLVDLEMNIRKLVEIDQKGHTTTIPETEE